MKAKYEIASQNDIPRIVDMKMEMFREFGYDRHLHINAPEMIATDYRRMYADNLAIHFLARVDNDIAGMVGAFIKSDIPFRYFSNSEYGFIGDVFTAPAHRNCGLSMKLNKQALDWMRERGVNFVRLLASDAGRPIYEQLGFTPDDNMILQLES